MHVRGSEDHGDQQVVQGRAADADGHGHKQQAVEELPDFLSRPLKPVDEAIKEQYLPEGWVEEFFTTYAPK